MTEGPERDQMVARVLADPHGKRLLADIEERAPFLAADYGQCIRRQRAEWETGGRES